MRLNYYFLKTVLNLYHEMFESGVSLVYLGEFSHQITKMFSTMAESEMVGKVEDKMIKKRIYHIIVETLQNMNKHSDEISGDDPTTGNGMFIIGQKDNTYYIVTANKIRNKKKIFLKLAIDDVNKATIKELKEMHKKQIREGTLSDKGGAGLGLIDIARKTSDKLQYQFIPIDEEYSFFILKVEIKA